MITFPRIAVELLRWMNKARVLDMTGIRVTVSFKNPDDYARMRQCIDDELRPSITTRYESFSHSTDIQIAGINWNFRVEKP